jgi:uncharacterized membrane protein YoaK (UPF0700 family)
MVRWPERAADLLLLTFAAGNLDALSYLRGHAFTANMTGNTVLLGLSLLGHDRQRTVPCLIALAAFVFGAAISTFALTRRSPPPDEAADLRSGTLLELPALAVFCAIWLTDLGGPAILLAGACALGIQSVAVRRLRISGVVTTFITGTITTAVINSIAPDSSPHSESGAPALLAVMFVTYLAAAAAGAFLYDAERRAACLAPLLACAIVAIRCRRAPNSR